MNLQAADFKSQSTILIWSIPTINVDGRTSYVLGSQSHPPDLVNKFQRTRTSW